MLFTILIERWRAAVAALGGLGVPSGRRDIFGLSKFAAACVGYRVVPRNCEFSYDASGHPDFPRR